jgi:hypothetical protein
VLIAHFITKAGRKHTAARRPDAAAATMLHAGGVVSPPQPFHENG